MKTRLSSFLKKAGILLGVTALAFVSTSALPGATAADAPTGVVAQPANESGALVRWTSTGGDGFRVETFDTAASTVTPVATTTCWACASARLSGLTIGRTYNFRVTPVRLPAPGTLDGPSVLSNSIIAKANATPVQLAAVAGTVQPGHVIDVTWKTATTGNAADLVVVRLLNSVGAIQREVQANADDLSKRFYVGTGKWYVAAAANNTGGNSAFRTAGPLTVGAECATADVCVNVDSMPSSPVQNIVGSGFNASIRYGVKLADAALTSALKPRNWRINSTTGVADTAPYAPSRTLTVATRWWEVTSPANGGFAKAPWNDWTGFRNWVTSEVTNARNAGLAPEYWELVNEPDLYPRSEFFSVTDRAAATRANVLQMMLVEYQAIKAADPTAKIVAPSLSAYIDAVNNPATTVNMRTFLEYAAANQMVIDALSWHEDADAIVSQDTTTAPPLVRDHVERARALVAHYPQVGKPAIFINEYGHYSTHLLPGWMVGHLAQFDLTHIDQANHVCYYAPECSEATLDGLLAKTGETWTGTKPAYWTHKLYADMAGSTQMMATTSMSWRAGALAAKNDATSTVRVLVGQHWSCAKPSGNTYCTSAYDPGAMTASVSIGWPYASLTAKVVVSRIPAGIAAIPGPTPVSTTTVPVVNGRLTVPLTGIGDGDAFSIVVTPA